MSTLTRFFKLNDGHSIPWIAIGSGSAFFMQDASAPIAQAIVGGVTHIDTSQKYRNEESVGAGIARAGVPRDQLFITTKLEGAVPKGGKVIDSLRGSLKKLGLDYVDLFLIHSPLQHDDLVAVWKGMEECKTAGLARSIGGANFQRKHLEQVVEGGSILPAVNQIEYHPYVYNSAAPILEYAKEKGIIIAAYSGLTPVNRHTEGPLKPILASIKERLTKERGAPVTEGQILIKWTNQVGVVSVTTTAKKERLQEYLDVEKLPDLTEEEVRKISGTNHHHRVFGFHMPGEL